LALRIVVSAVVVIGLCLVVLPVLVSASTDVASVGTTFFSAFAAVWTLSWVRALMLKVEVAVDDTLFVRNAWRTRVFRRGDVEQFRLPARGLTGLAQGNGVLALLADGTVLRLDATVGWPLPGRRAQLERIVNELNDWAARGGRP
jgi:hypothetical protein